MKNFGKIVLAAAVVLPALFTGCKKGENDPFLSIHSRKARVAGEWKVTDGKGTDVQTGTNSFGSTTTTDNWTYDGATWTNSRTVAFTPTSGSGTSGTTTTSTSITMSYTFDKDGTWKSTEVVTATNGDMTTTNTSGTWNFTGGVGEIKNKEQIALMTDKTEVIDYDQSSQSSSTTVTESTGSESSPQIITLDELKNKEMIWKMTGTTSSSGSSTSADDTFTLTQ
jgi:hypothetical protein